MTLGTGPRAACEGEGCGGGLLPGCGGAGADATTMSTAVPCGACELASGCWPTIVPGLVSATAACATVPSARPACSRLPRASSMLDPITLGTVTAFGPALMSTATTEPGCTSLPPAGS